MTWRNALLFYRAPATTFTCCWRSNLFAERAGARLASAAPFTSACSSAAYYGIILTILRDGAVAAKEHGATCAFCHCAMTTLFFLFARMLPFGGGNVDGSSSAILGDIALVPLLARCVRAYAPSLALRSACTIAFAATAHAAPSPPCSLVRRVTRKLTAPADT
jgi:hypothetical protein